MYHYLSGTIWTNVCLLLNGPLKTNCREIKIKIKWSMLSAKCWLFCFVIHVLAQDSRQLIPGNRELMLSAIFMCTFISMLIGHADKIERYFITLMCLYEQDSFYYLMKYSHKLFITERSHLAYGHWVLWWNNYGYNCIKNKCPKMRYRTRS